MVLSHQVVDDVSPHDFLNTGFGHGNVKTLSKGTPHIERLLAQQSISACPFGLIRAGVQGGFPIIQWVGDVKITRLTGRYHQVVG